MSKFARAAALLVAAASATASGGCSMFGDDVWEGRRQELERNRARWEQLRVDDYHYTVRRSCECIPALYGTVVVTVRDGVIVGVVPQDGRTPPPPQQWPAFGTIDRLFETVAHAIEERAYQFDVHYDRSRGFPTAIGLDIDRRMVDDEITIQASELVASQPPLGLARPEQ